MSDRMRSSRPAKNMATTSCRFRRHRPRLGSRPCTIIHERYTAGFIKRRLGVDWLGVWDRVTKVARRSHNVAIMAGRRQIAWHRRSTIPGRFSQGRRSSGSPSCAWWWTTSRPCSCTTTTAPRWSIPPSFLPPYTRCITGCALLGASRFPSFASSWWKGRSTRAAFPNTRCACSCLPW